MDTFTKSKTQQAVRTLKEQGEDYEFYPTTKCIIGKLWKDIISYVKKEHHSGYSERGNLCYSDSFRDNENDVLHIDSFLDIGTGDGRVMLPPDLGVDIKINRRTGVEKSSYHADQLIRDGVWMLGRDYMTTTILDKKFDIVFSNPPYSIFKSWCEKMLSEVDAEVIYLLIPERWKDDVSFKARIEMKGEVKVVGSYNFEQGDREARAKVNLIRITKVFGEESSFSKWVSATIGDFERKPELELEVEEEEFINTHMTERKDITSTLIENYEREMKHLMKNYKALSEIDFSLLEQIEVSRETIINSIASDIKTLKYKYWEKALTHISSFKTRLTYKTSSSILEDLKEFKDLDFNTDNVRNVMIWVIEHFNDLSQKQMLKCYDDMSYFGNVRAYKSNDNWIKDSWRYSKPFPTKYQLDYRFVTSGNSLSRYNFNDRDAGLEMGWHQSTDNLVSDLAVIACSLGYHTDGLTFQIDHGKQYDILDSEGEVLYSFRMYKNGNLHFKIRQDFLRDFNISVGKLKGWIKSPKDIRHELEISEKEMSDEEIEKYFEEDQIMLMKPQTFQNLLT